jgi:hypothetical protein
MAVEAEQPKNELTPEEIDNLISSNPWYDKLLNDLRELLRQEGAIIVPVKHKIGKRILKARAELNKPVTDKRGWSGNLGDLMNKLSVALELSIAELYNCLGFAEKFSWDKFVDERFPINKRDSRGLETPTTLRGKDLTWEEVKTQVLHHKRTRPEVQGTGGSSSEDKAKNITSPVFTITAPANVLRRFREIAFTNKTTPEDLLREFIENYIKSNVGQA